MTMPNDIAVNGRSYRWMDRPLVVVCLDGCQHEYCWRGPGPRSWPIA
jgi:hypothetical protein